MGMIKQARAGLLIVAGTAYLWALPLTAIHAQVEPRDTGGVQERIDFAALVEALEHSRHTLKEVIGAADRPPTRPIAARFFVRGGRPMIEVVTAERGYYLTADENLLKTRRGPADEPRWAPAPEELVSVEDVARAAMYLTLIQTSPLTLPDFIARAEAEFPGRVIAVVPESPNLEPSVEVLMLHQGKLWELDYGLDGELDERKLEWAGN